MRSSIASLVDNWRANGSQTAIATYAGNRRHSTTYSQLLNLTARFAAELDRRNIVAGERVVVWGRNSAEWVAAFFGCVLRGVLVVPLDAAGSPEFAHRVIRETSPRLVTGDTDHLLLLGEGVPMLSYEDFLARLPTVSDGLAGINVSQLTRETPLQIMFTSGTTSEPKGVVHTHGNVLASVEPIEREMQKYLRYEKPFHPLRFLHTLPLSHVFGQFMGLWLPPLLAAEVHFEDRLEAERLVRTIHRERISVLAAVPRVLELMRAHLLARKDDLALQIANAQGLPIAKRFWRFRRIHSLLGWKFWACVCGGASLPAELEQFWTTMGYAVIQGYGMTETTALITLNHPFKIAPGTIGKPLPGREIRIGADGEISVRGEMVAVSTWQHGRMETRSDPWLATGDLVAQDQQGQLQFVGRKSEVIVTSAGLNIHPEDVEAALMKRSEVSMCAVVAITQPNGGQEPVAVLVVPAGAAVATDAVLAANRELAEYQRVRRWHLWPEAELPRTSTGKVQRGKVAAWVREQDAEAATGGGHGTTDPLLALIADVTGSAISHASDDAKLQEDLRLDSLGRLQLQSAIEQKFGVALDDREFTEAETLGQLRALSTRRPGQAARSSLSLSGDKLTKDGEGESGVAPSPALLQAGVRQREYTYPRWPWAQPIAMARTLFLEAVVRPLVWILLKPKVTHVYDGQLTGRPMLLIANHVTLFDVPLVLYALPPQIRRRTAVAMAGEMLEDWKHGVRQTSWWRNLLAPMQYWLLTALFNVFPLPQQAGVRRSFAHVGEALDRGYHVLVFPEGRRSADGVLQPFRSGIGLLAEQSKALVLPAAMRGMDQLVARKKRWFHAGSVEIRVGAPLAIEPSPRSEDVVRRLQDAMEALLG